MKKILFYSSVSDISLFNTQKFYKIDIDLLRELGFEVIPTNKRMEFLKFWKYNITFCYFYKWAFIPAIISRIFLKKVYFTGGIDDLSKDKNTKLYKRQKLFFKICYFLSTKCFIVSSEDLKNVSDIISNTKKIIKSYHSIDIAAFDRNGANKRSNNFFSIAWMKNKDNVIRKGVDKALLLFERLLQNKEYADSIFYIAGIEGEGSDYLKQIIKDNNIKNVVFLGNITEEKKIEYLSNVKYYFQLSEYEGFGLAALEALAAGCIVIHSGRGGLKDCIANNGIIVDIASPVTDQINELEIKLKDFNKKQLSDGIKRINSLFSNERRRNDFSIICN